MTTQKKRVKIETQRAVFFFVHEFQREGEKNGYTKRSFCRRVVIGELINAPTNSCNELYKMNNMFCLAVMCYKR